MLASSLVSRLSALRDRAGALPLDPAPLRRAGVLSVLLVALLLAGKVFGPSPRAAAERHAVPAVQETVSAAPTPPAAVAPAPRATWTGGRVLAILLLLVGGGVALVLRKRAPGGAGGGGDIEVLASHTLAPGQTLRLVAAGGDVLLLGAGSDGVRLLRAWPRGQFGQPPSFADALASAQDEAPPTAAPHVATAPGAAPAASSQAAPAPIDGSRPGLSDPPLPTARGVLFPLPAPRQFLTAADA